VIVRVTWASCGEGLEVLHLGEVPVGRVSLTAGRRGRPAWVFNLAGSVAFWATAPSIEEARTSLLATLSHWLTRAGIPHQELRA
jgi:hypothetical protein